MILFNPTRTMSYSGKMAHIFLEGICSKVIVNTQLEFDLGYNNDTVQYVSHSATVIAPVII